MNCFPGLYEIEKPGSRAGSIILMHRLDHLLMDFFLFQESKRQPWNVQITLKRLATTADCSRESVLFLRTSTLMSSQAFCSSRQSLSLERTIDLSISGL